LIAVICSMVVILAKPTVKKQIAFGA